MRTLVVAVMQPFIQIILQRVDAVIELLAERATNGLKPVRASSPTQSTFAAFRISPGKTPLFALLPKAMQMRGLCCELTSKSQPAIGKQIGEQPLPAFQRKSKPHRSFGRGGLEKTRPGQR